MFSLNCPTRLFQYIDLLKTQHQIPPTSSAHNEVYYLDKRFNKENVQKFTVQ